MCHNNTGKGLITFYNPTPFKIVKLHLVHRISVVSHLHFVYKLQVQSAGVVNQYTTDFIHL